MVDKGSVFRLDRSADEQCVLYSFGFVYPRTFQLQRLEAIGFYACCSRAVQLDDVEQLGTCTYSTKTRQQDHFRLFEQY